MHVDLSQTVSGTGSLLIKKAIEFIRRRSFERVEVNVIAANSGVRHLYEAHGWELVRELTVSKGFLSPYTSGVAVKACVPIHEY